MTSGIYKIANKVSGDAYVGQSSNIKNRWKNIEPSCGMESITIPYCNMLGINTEKRHSTFQ